jgi:hypothetical protein
VKGQAESWRFWKLGLEDRQRYGVAETRMKGQAESWIFQRLG